MVADPRAIRILRVLGAALLLGAIVMVGWTVLIETNDGYAASTAANSICNSERCAPGQLQSMMLFAGPVSVLLFGGFGLAMLKARASAPDAATAAPGAGTSSV